MNLIHYDLCLFYFSSIIYENKQKTDPQKKEFIQQVRQNRQ